MIATMRVAEKAMRFRMACRSCQSNTEIELTAEMNIHFSGIMNVDKPSVWAFPRVIVCLNCGFVEFVLEADELLHIREIAA
jgi:predicted nucleic-acid-binding Zn-ribbon protein